jgi:peroxiredoxin
VGFGLSEWSARPIGVLLPLLELCVAVALLPESTAWWGAAGALLLLTTFVIGISVSLARGRAPDCHCFGQLHSAPASSSTLIRSGVLASTAAFVVVQGQDGAGPSAVGWLSDLSAAEWAALLGAAFTIIALATVGRVLVALLRQNGRLLLRIESLEARLGQSAATHAHDLASVGLPVGTPAPPFELGALAGPSLTLDDLLTRERPVLLVFTEPQCVPCAALLPQLKRWQSEHAERLTVAVISQGDRAVNRKIADQGLTAVLLQEGREVRVAYDVPGTPGAVLIHQDGTVASEVAMGADAIQQLVADAVERPVMSQNGKRNVPIGRLVPWGAKPGESAPDFRLPDLTGAYFELSDLRGHDTMLLFWDPGCGFCQRMLDDLRAWERRSPAGAPKAVLISVGDAAANRAMGLSSLILLDESSELRRPFGIPGTPSAVLVDAHNTIASEVAVGADAVLELAGYEPAVLSS